MINQNKKKIIILMGPPGVGKGTLSQYIKEQYTEVDHIAIGTKLRQIALSESSLGKRVKKLIDGGNFLDDNTINDIVEEIFYNFLFVSSSKSTLLLDGFPRNRTQFQLFLNLFNKYQQYFEYKIFFLFLSREKLKKRLMNRYICTICDQIYSIDKVVFNDPNFFSCQKCKMALTKRADDSIEVIEKRLKIYFEEEENIFSFLKYNSISYSSYENVDSSIVNLGKRICSEVFDCF